MNTLSKYVLKAGLFAAITATSAMAFAMADYIVVTKFYSDYYKTKQVGEKYKPCSPSGIIGSYMVWGQPGPYSTLIKTAC